MDLMSDAMTAIGFVRVVKHDVETGDVVSDRLFKNQITNYARSCSARLWAGEFLSIPSKIAVGVGSAPVGELGVTPSDTKLWSELSGTRKQVDYAETWLQYYVQYSITYNQTEALGTVDATNTTGNIQITEAGLFDANGNLWSHVKLDDTYHDNTTTLSIQWLVLHQGN